VDVEVGAASELASPEDEGLAESVLDAPVEAALPVPVEVGAGEDAADESPVTADEEGPAVALAPVVDAGVSAG
jgi:hypothetical protein